MAAGTDAVSGGSADPSTNARDRIGGGVTAAWAALTVCLLLVSGCGSKESGPATFIANATIYDGSGDSAVVGSVRIVGDSIAALGNIRPRNDDWFVDGAGLALAPGFIDTHSHADYGIGEHRDALAAVSQGITTVIVGQDGGSEFPLKDFFARLDSTLARLDSAAGNADAILGENRAAINSFANDGLGQLGPTLTELRGLIRDLRQISDRLEGNPSRFLLGRGAPKEYEPQ